MDQWNRFSYTATFVGLSSMAFLGLLGSARAETTAQEPPKADEAPKAAPAAEATTPAPAAGASAEAAPTGDTSAQAAPAAPKCECPPPCPAPPPPPPPPEVEWKAQIKGGMLISTGNAQSKNFNLGILASRKEGNNKLTLEAGFAYGKSIVAKPKDDPNQPNIIVLDQEETVTTNNMAAKARYDRFLTEHNTAFAAGLAAADKIAGKTFFGGGQLGYSRLLLQDQWNLVVAELGYDFSYERYLDPQNKPVNVHSARVFVGETLSLTKQTGVTASVEGLFNLWKEKDALNVNTGDPGVDPFKDIRLNAKIGLTTNLWKSLSFGFSFALKYDENPAPRPLPKDTESGRAFAKTDPNFFSDKVDTYTEATLIYSFF